MEDYSQPVAQPRFGLLPVPQQEHCLGAVVPRASVLLGVADLQVVVPAALSRHQQYPVGVFAIPASVRLVPAIPKGLH